MIFRGTLGNRRRVGRVQVASLARGARECARRAGSHLHVAQIIRYAIVSRIASEPDSFRRSMVIMVPIVPLAEVTLPLTVATVPPAVAAATLAAI